MTKCKCVLLVTSMTLASLNTHAGLVQEPLPDGWYWSKQGVPVQRLQVDIPADASPRVKWLLQRIEENNEGPRPSGRGVVTLDDDVQVESNPQGGYEYGQQSDQIESNEEAGIEKAQHCESDYREKVGRNGQRQIIKTHSCKSREGGPQELYPHWENPHPDLE